MTLPKEQIEKFKRLKDHGDQKRIALLIGIKSRAHISRIMSGTQSTSSSKIGRIVMFLNEKEKQIKQIIEND